MEKHMTNVMFDGVYRDDGSLMFNKKVTAEKSFSWRNSFQAPANRLTQAEHLQLWDPSTLQRAPFHPLQILLQFVLL